MRNVISILLLAVILAASLTACSSEKTVISSTTSTVAGEHNPVKVSTNDDKTPMIKIAELLNGKTLIEVFRTRPAATMEEMYNQGYTEYLPGF